MATDKIDLALKKTFNCEDFMQSPDVVDKILLLRKEGWGQKRIAKELGINKATVRRYIRQGGWAPPQIPKRPQKLDGLESWLEETFYKHHGNAVVVHQELIREHGIKVSLRTVEYAVKPYRRLLQAKAIATVRFETPPGKQLQIDFGSMTLKIKGEDQRVYFFVSTLGFSRRPYVQAFSNERQCSWFEGMEGAFRHFNGVPQQILMDNPRPLVTKHNPRTREVVFNDRLHAFAHYWKFQPKACAPYRARTKGKDESGVKYVKKNAIAGREFSSWEDLQEHLAWWMKEVADERIHGTTGEKPIDRFKKEEISALQPLNGKAPFIQIRELDRVVHADSCVEVDTNTYSVPWRLIKEKVIVQVIDTEVKIFHDNKEIACHLVCVGQRQRSIQPKHLEGVAGAAWISEQKVEVEQHSQKIVPAEFQRSLCEYESAIGGGW